MRTFLLPNILALVLASQLLSADMVTPTRNIPAKQRPAVKAPNKTTPPTQSSKTPVKTK